MSKIVVTGAAGLVGQNLIPRLLAQGLTEVVAIDKHPTNVATLRNYHPEIRIVHQDLAQDGSGPGGWEDELAECTALVIAHAQIGGSLAEEFVRNNVEASRRLIAAALKHNVPYLVNISSSVVNS